MMTPEEIEELGEKWVTATRNDDGSVSIPANQQHRLLANGIQFHDLDRDGLRAAARATTRVLLLPGLNMMVDQDHITFWSWMTEVVSEQVRARELLEGWPTSREDSELTRLWHLCYRAAAASSTADWARMDVNARELIGGGHTVLAYLSLPLVEGIGRRSCSEYVAMDGLVLKDFTLLSSNRSYRANGKRRCNSIGDIVKLTMQVGSSELASDLEYIERHLHELGEPDDTDGWAVLNRWRNSSLHGEASFPTVGGTLFNVAALMVLDWYDDYENTRQQALRCSIQEIQSARAHKQLGAATEHYLRSHWSFYPPRLPD